MRVRWIIFVAMMAALASLAGPARAVGGPGGGGLLLGIGPDPSPDNGSTRAWTLDPLGGGATRGLDFLLDYPNQDSVSFSADGTRVVYKDDITNHVKIRDTAGTVVDLGATVTTGKKVDNLQFAGSAGQYVVGWEQGSATLTRYEPGQAPVDLSAHLADFSNAFPRYVALDAHSPNGWFSAGGDVYQIDLTSGGVAPVTANCHKNPDTLNIECGAAGFVHQVMDVNPVDGRLLVAYNPGTTNPSPSALGWLASGQSAATPIHSLVATDEFFPFINADNIQVASVSPDGSLVAWNRHFTNTTPESDRTVVLPSAGGAEQVQPESYLHTDWQPCPTGTCPVFPAPGTVPKAPLIGTASSGATGGSVTATARWTPGANGGSPITSFTVQAVRVSSTGSVLSSRNFVRSAAARSATLSLARGRYKFRVRAANAQGAGPLSRYSNIVTAR